MGRKDGGKTWESLTPANVWAPGVSGWREKTTAPPVTPPTVGAWTAGEAVKAGDLRSYGGKTYRVVTWHTTQAGWEPPAVPALWALA